MIFSLRFLYALCLLSVNVYGQSSNFVLDFSDFLNNLKQYHPLIKQADLLVDKGQSKLIKAKGAFDPKIEANYQAKRFKNIPYFDKVQAGVKVPIWNSIDIKMSLERNGGQFLNPDESVPEQGLYNIGVSIPLLREALISQRAATVKQAKLFAQQTLAERRLKVQKIISQAAITYFAWLKAYREKQLYENFVSNTQLRYEGILRSYQVGNKPAIDTVEARINLTMRRFQLEKATLQYRKAFLELSNYMWVEGDTPAQLQDSVTPKLDILNQVDRELNTNSITTNTFDLSNHAKLISLGYKYRQLRIEENLKKNQLLPTLDIQYNLLTSKPTQINSLSPSAYKWGFQFSFPLFLRKIRGDLQLTQIKIASLKYQQDLMQLRLQNKLIALQTQLETYERQQEMAAAMAVDYQILLTAEQRKFDIGESTLFLVNSRESKLIDSQLKVILLQNQILNTKAKWSATLVNFED